MRIVRFTTSARCAPFLALACASLLGCGPSADTRRDAGLRGPEGGVLTFDAAMLDDASMARDAGVADVGPRPNDSGPRDAGPRDAGRSCTGVAYACATVGATSCTSQRGCRRDGECGGVSTSCFSLFSSFACISQDGCIWDSSRDRCSGSAWFCSSYSGSSSCTAQRGCDWRDTCDGVAYSCSLLNELECGLQLGCRWE